MIARYCRDQKLFALPEAIRKMTGLSARNFGLVDRGEIREGAFADLTLFDLDTIQDTATFSDPIAPARGIELVTVNGQIAWQHGEPASARGACSSERPALSERCQT